MSSSSNTTNNVINPKPCNYNCGTRIYWNTATSEYWEVFTRKKHVCPNRSNNNNNVSKSSTSYVSKPTYYKKSWSNTPKPKMSNSLELISGPVSEVQRKYELLSDIVTEVNGRVHGSQSTVNGNNISLVVYYEVPAEGNTRDLIKQRFKSIVFYIIDR